MTDGRRLGFVELRCVCVCVLFCAGFGCCAEVKHRWGGYAFSRQMEVVAF